MTFLLLPLLFGNIVLSAPLVLLSGLWIDFGYVILLAFRWGREELLLPGNTLLSSNRPVRARMDRVVASVLAGGTVLLLSILLSAFGVLANEGERTIFVFLSLLTVQTTALLLYYYGGSARGEQSLSSRLPALGATLLILMPPLLLLCFPRMAYYMGCGTCSLLLLVLSWTAAPIFVLCSLLCASLRGRVKRWLRKILSALDS